MLTKRDRERQCFEKFRMVCGLSGTPTFGDKPDVILKSDRIIGVEVTNFYIEGGEDETSEQRQRPRRAKVIADAQALHRAAGRRKIELTITFNPTQAITVDFTDPAQDQEITVGPLSVPFSVFERIFVYKTVTNEILEVTRL